MASAQGWAKALGFKMIDDQPPLLHPADITHPVKGRWLRCVNALPGT